MAEPRPEALALMPSQHKTPLLGWHPPAELLARIRGEVKRRGITLAAWLSEAASAHLDHHDPNGEQQ
jgi:hypothetical protein